MAIKQIAYSLIFCLACSFGFAQRGISYQGVILYPTVEIPGVDSSVTPYSERDVCMRFSIYDENNVLEYIETHTTTTDYYGQVNLVIGRGDNPSPASRLDGLRWDGTAKFLKVDLDYDAACINWTDVSYDELHYVPFAFYALNADGVGTDNQNLTGDTLTGTSLQIDIENGTSATVDLAPLQVGAGTDDQNLTGATLTGTSLQIDIEDGNSATVDLAALNTDDQNLTGATLTGTSLQIDIEDGNSATVDLAALVDDADAVIGNEYNISFVVDNTAGKLKLTDGGGELSVDLNSLSSNRSSYVDSGNAHPLNNPLKIGEGTTNLPNYINIEEADVILIDNGSSNVYIKLERLLSGYDGKVVRIVEVYDENPRVTVENSAGVTTDYFNVGANKNYLYDQPIDVITDVNFTAQTKVTTTINKLYEVVNFVWSDSEGKWFPMR